jgi:hypothetical protein
VFFWLIGKSKRTTSSTPAKGIAAQTNDQQDGVSSNLFQSNPNSVNHLDPDMEADDLNL